MSHKTVIRCECSILTELRGPTPDCCTQFWWKACGSSPDEVIAPATSMTAEGPEKKAGWGDSAYYQIELSFTDMPDKKLLPGMSVRVVIPAAQELSHAR